MNRIMLAKSLTSYGLCLEFGLKLVLNNIENIEEDAFLKEMLLNHAKHSYQIANDQLEYIKDFLEQDSFLKQGEEKNNAEKENS